MCGSRVVISFKLLWKAKTKRSFTRTKLQFFPAWLTAIIREPELLEAIVNCIYVHGKQKESIKMETPLSIYIYISMQEHTFDIYFDIYFI